MKHVFEPILAFEGARDELSNYTLVASIRSYLEEAALFEALDCSMDYFFKARMKEGYHIVSV